MVCTSSILRLKLSWNGLGGAFFQFIDSDDLTLSSVYSAFFDDNYMQNMLYPFLLFLLRRGCLLEGFRMGSLCSLSGIQAGPWGKTNNDKRACSWRRSSLTKARSAAAVHEACGKKRCCQLRCQLVHRQ